MACAVVTWDAIYLELAFRLNRKEGNFWSFGSGMAVQPMFASSKFKPNAGLPLSAQFRHMLPFCFAPVSAVDWQASAS